MAACGPVKVLPSQALRAQMSQGIANMGEEASPPSTPPMMNGAGLQRPSRQLAGVPGPVVQPQRTSMPMAPGQPRTSNSRPHHGGPPGALMPMPPGPAGRGPGGSYQRPMAGGYAVPPPGVKMPTVSRGIGVRQSKEIRPMPTSILQSQSEPMPVPMVPMQHHRRGSANVVLGSVVRPGIETRRRQASIDVPTVHQLIHPAMLGASCSANLQIRRGGYCGGYEPGPGAPVPGLPAAPPMVATAPMVAAPAGGRRASAFRTEVGRTAGYDNAGTVRSTRRSSIVDVNIRR